MSPMLNLGRRQKPYFGTNFTLCTLSCPEDTYTYWAAVQSWPCCCVWSILEAPPWRIGLGQTHGSCFHSVKKTKQNETLSTTVTQKERSPLAPSFHKQKFCIAVGEISNGPVSWSPSATRWECSLLALFEAVIIWPTQAPINTAQRDPNVLQLPDTFNTSLHLSWARVTAHGAFLAKITFPCTQPRTTTCIRQLSRTGRQPITLYAVIKLLMWRNQQSTTPQRLKKATQEVKQATKIKPRFAELQIY